jgi:hypothetical protein
MSTRCHIIIEDEYNKVILYRHSDGYPNGEHGVLASLVPFIQRFMKHRGWEVEYLAAQLICDQINRAREYSRKLYEERAATDPEDGYWQARLAEVDDDFLGFGISNEIHVDVEYIYHVTKDQIQVQDGEGKNLTTAAQAKALMRGKIPKKYA